MKKQLMLLSLSLLLASCGGNPTASEPASQPASGDETSSQTTSSDNSASSSTAELTKLEKLQALFAKMAETGNCTVTEDGVSTTEYLGGDKGFLTVYDSSQLTGSSNLTGYGIAKFANYGLVQYYYINDTAGVDASTTKIVSPNKNISFEDYDNSVKTLGSSAANVTFTESSRTHTFSATDEEFVKALAALDGYYDEEGTYTTFKATFSLNDDATEITASYVFDGSGTASKYSRAGLVISSFGTTKNTNVESYLASTLDLKAPTAWGADTLSLFSSVDANLNVPFPAGATYAASTSLSYDEDLSGYLVFKDLGCGNISSAYGASLVSAGFAVDPENTGSSNGTSLYGYKKTFENENAMKGKTELTFVLLYQTGTTAEDQKFYPNGIFAIYVFEDIIPATVTESDVNAFLSTFKVDWNQAVNAFPTFSFGSNCTKIEFLDQTEATEAYYNQVYAQYAAMLGYTSITVEFKVAATAYLYYATQAEAEAAKTSIASTLTAATFVESTDYPGSFGLSDPNESSEWEIEVDLSVATTTSSTSAAEVYSGYLKASFFYSKMTIVQ